MIKKLKEMSLKKKILICIGLAIIILLAWRIYKLIPKTEGRRGLREVSVAVEIVLLKKLYVDIGSSVYNGQLVAEIEDEYRQQVIQAEADLRVARANLEETKSALELSKKEFERAQTLHQKGIMFDAQLDAVKAQYESEESRYKVASVQVSNREAALETAKIRFSYTKIQVSWEGGSPIRYVGERFVHEGALLSPNTPIISIVELQPLIAVVFVTEKEYYRLKVGQCVRAYSTVFPEKIFTGK
ncbi:MAG: efflux RND transporter periplasmic adaptor subunit [Candidatus Aminicenantia bacterium]